MKFFRSADEKAYDKARKRLDSVALPQVHDWANNAIWVMQEGLERGAGDSAAVQQVRDNTIVLIAALDSLLDRMD